MFDEINNLPADDPLRSGRRRAAMPQMRLRRLHGRARCAAIAAAAAARTLAHHWTSAGEGGGCLRGEWRDEFGDAGRGVRRCASCACRVRRRCSRVANGSVVVDAGQRVAVPSFAGAALRKVVETAAGLGLRVEPVGSGIAREQAPAAGTMVPLGTEVVVRFAR